MSVVRLKSDGCSHASKRVLLFSCYPQWLSPTSAAPRFRAARRPWMARGRFLGPSRGPLVGSLGPLSGLSCACARSAHGAPRRSPLWCSRVRPKTAHDRLPASVCLRGLPKSASHGCPGYAPRGPNGAPESHRAFLGLLGPFQKPSDGPKRAPGGSQEGPKRAPRRLQEDPKRAPREAPKGFPRGPYGGSNKAKWLKICSATLLPKTCFFGAL
eukprot:6945675-Pyramimonas_sp.AAC.1